MKYYIALLLILLIIIIACQKKGWYRLQIVSIECVAANNSPKEIIQIEAQDSILWEQKIPKEKYQTIYQDISFKHSVLFKVWAKNEAESPTLLGRVKANYQDLNKKITATVASEGMKCKVVYHVVGF